MISVTTNIPRQKIPDSEKTDEWAQNTIQAYINISRFNRSQFTDDFMEKLYKYYAGEIDDDDYTHVTKPFDSKKRNMPAKVHNYNILKPTVDILLGEKSKRGSQFTVINTNPDSVSAKKEAKKQFLSKVAFEYYLSELKKAGIPVDAEDMESLPNNEEIEQAFEESYTDRKSMAGQDALNYLHHDLELKDKFIEGFKHFLISGYVFSYRGVNYDEVEYDILNPLDVDGDKDPDIEFYEDGDWAITRKLSFPSSVIDYYFDDLTPEQIDRLEQPQGQYSPDFISRSGAANSFTRDDENQYNRRERAIEVIRCFWKCRKKIGFLTYLDEFGILQEEIVDESYKQQEGEKVQWEWINEIWEGHRIDGDIFVRLRPIEIERRDLDNPSKCKLPINGRKYSDMNSSPISLLMLGIPYQISFNIYKYKLDLAVAKSKDRVAQFDINAIPAKWKPEDFMYWVESTGIAWVDYNKEGISYSPQHKTVMDLTVQTISHYIELLQAIIQEWERISGVNAQRAGVIGEYEGKATSQQAIIQSSYVTEDLFRKYSRYEQRDLQGIMDYAQYAMENGKVAQYVADDKSIKQIEIDGAEFSNSEYGVFVSNQGKDLENVDILKQMIQPMIQNGTPISVVAQMINSENFSDIRSKIEKAEKASARQAQKMQELEMQQAQQEQQFEIEKLEREDLQNIRDNETKLEIARMKAEADKEEARINDRED